MVGFPHSEIIGSKLIRSSPTLIAAYYVLHRLCTPRHPLDALKTLDRSHYQCPQHQQRQPLLKANVSVVRIVDCQRIAAPAFDRSDQINQNSRGVSVSPRGAGQTKQKAISLRCRKIRTVITEVTSKSKLALLINTRLYRWGGFSRREPAPRCTAAPTGKPEGLQHFGRNGGA